LREISRAQSIVVDELLAGPRASGNRPPEDHVPRRTRHRIRHRLYSLGWLKDRYVPDPSALGRPIITFAISQPFTDRLPQMIASWRSQDECVHLWASGGTLFGVFLNRRTEESRPLVSRLSDYQMARSEYFLSCDSSVASVPVFFDFEASWAQLTGLQGTLGYPHSLPSGAARVVTPARVLSSRDAAAMVRMLSRGFVAGGGNEPFPRLALLGREGRLLSNGLLEPRTILDPIACAHSASDFPRSITLMHGNLVEHQAPLDLFGALLGEGGVNPFLFATDGGSVLLAYLSDRANGQDLAQQGLGSMALPAVQVFLERIVTLREPLQTLTTILDHRYDRPFLDPGSEWG